MLKQLTKKLRRMSGRRQPPPGGVLIVEEQRRVVKYRRRTLTDRRAQPRFALDELTDESDRFFVYSPDLEARFEVRDLSAGGLCVIVPSPAGWTIGDARSVSLQLGPVEVPLRVAVINHQKGAVGLRILSAPSVWVNEIGRLLDPRRIGQQLKEVAALSADSGPRRFKSPPACDLYVWYRGASVDRAQVLYLGYLVDWSRSGLRTTAAPASMATQLRRPLEVKEPDVPPNEELLHTVRAILRASAVPREIARLFEA